MGEKISNEKIDRVKNHLYFVGSDGYVWKTPMRFIKDGKKEKVGTEFIQKKAGYIYYVGKDGYVYEAKMRNVKV